MNRKKSLFIPEMNLNNLIWQINSKNTKINCVSLSGMCGTELYRAFDGVDYVVHAAALKQVPSCEYNPMEAVKTNINGAMNIVDAALDCGVKRVVALSTDKAVNPINLYGGTKLVSDELFIAANAYSGEKMCAFRLFVMEM